MIKIQKEDFNLEEEISCIQTKHTNIGAVSSFVGFVRDVNKNKKVQSINIEVYEEMAIKSLSTICSNAHKKWNLIDSLVIHRYGNLKISERIVLITTFAMHRENSIAACNYIIDYLKKDAPFWKNEFYEKDSSWL